MLRVRVRYPDGRSSVLSGLAATMPLADLLARVGEGRATCPRLIIAGPPPRPVDGAPDEAIGGLIRDGDALLVEVDSSPAGGVASGAVGKGGGGRRRGTGRGRGRGGATGTGRAFKRAGAGRTLGSSVASVAAGSARAGGGDVEGCVTSMEDKVAAQVAGAMDKSAAGGEAKRFRAAAREERRERERQAEGQRRYEAVASKRFDVHYYQFEGDDSLLFKARYKGVGEKAWRTDPPEDDAFFPAWGRPVVAAALADVLNDAGELEEGGSMRDELRARLRPMAMARYSPRLFWNVVRLFKDRIDAGLEVEAALHELVPDADWAFLTERRREKSKKAKINAEMEMDGYQVDKE